MLKNLQIPKADLFFQVALELASHMDLQKVAMEERLPIYKADQVNFV